MDWKIQSLIASLTVNCVTGYFTYRFFTFVPPKAEVITVDSSLFKQDEHKLDLRVEKDVPVIKERIVYRQSKCDAPERIIEERIVENYLPGKETVVEKEVVKETAAASQKTEKRTEPASPKHHVTFSPSYNLGTASFSFGFAYTYFPLENLGIGPTLQMNQRFDRIESVGLGVTFRF